MRSLKIIASAATLAILSLAGCGGGGGDSSSSSIPTALLPSTTTPNGGAVQPAVPASAPAPAEKRVVTLTVGSSSFSGMKTIQAVNNVAASAPLAASAPAATVPLPTTSAGMITASPINQVFHLNRSADGLSFYGWSDVAGTYLIPVADLKMVCANGFQTGLSIMGNTSRACAAPDLVANTVTLPGTCSRDVNFYTAFLISRGDGGEPLYADFTSERKFTTDPAGLPGVILANGAQINWGDYQGATIKVTKTADGKATLRLDSGSNCAGQFGKQNPDGTGGHLVNLDISDLANKPLAYDWNADNAGVSGGPGWGGAAWVDKSGNNVPPSAFRAYPEFDKVTGNFFVEITGLPCTSAGSVTVYRGAKNPDGSYTYDPKLDAAGPFGEGWLPIQANPAEYQIWTLLGDPSVTATLDRTKFQLVYSCN